MRVADTQAIGHFGLETTSNFPHVLLCSRLLGYCSLLSVVKVTWRAIFGLNILSPLENTQSLMKVKNDCYISNKVDVSMGPNQHPINMLTEGKPKHIDQGHFG